MYHPWQINFHFHDATMTSTELAPLVLRKTSKRINWQGIHPNSNELTKEQKEKLRKDLHRMSMRNRGKKRSRDVSMHMLRTVCSNPISKSMKHNKSSFHYQVKRRRRIDLSKTLPSLKVHHKKALGSRIDVHEEALIAHIFDLCDINMTGFIRRSEFLTCLKFDKEIRLLIKGSKIAKGSNALKKLKDDEDVQMKFYEFRTQHVQNMELSELLAFLGKREGKEHKLPGMQVGFGKDESTSGNMNVISSPVTPTSLESKDAITQVDEFNRTVMSQKYRLLSLKSRLIASIRYKIKENRAIQSIYQAGEFYRAGIKLLNSAAKHSNEKLLLVLEPTISSAELRIKKVEKLISMYENHKIMKKKILKADFLGYEEIREKFLEGIQELEEDFNAALGMERYSGVESTDSVFANRFAEVRRKQRTFQKKLKLLFWELKRENWPNNSTAIAAATKFQSLWRITKAKEVYSLKKKLRNILENVSSKKITGFLRRMLNRQKRKRARREKILVLAITTQRIYRGFLGRNLAKVKRRQQLNARKVRLAFQSRMNTLRLRRQAEREFAATKIQKLYRGFAVRSLYKIEKARRDHRNNLFRLEMERKALSATSIQKVWRGHLGRKLASDKLQRYLQKQVEFQKIQHQACATIQRVARGNIAREYVCKVRVQKTSAALMIQKWIRGMIERRRLATLSHQKRLNEEHYAAEKIQKLMRGFLATNHVHALRRQKQQKSSVTIQRYIRGMHGRKQASIMQKEKQRRHRELLMRKRSLASIKIQKIIRGRIARDRLRQYHQNMEIKQVSAILIQKLVRGKLARNYVIKKENDLLIQLCLKEKEEAAEEEVAKAASLERKEKEDQKRQQKMLSLQQLTTKQNNAAIKIQSFVRGYFGRILARQKKQILLRKRQQIMQHIASIKIQKTVRGHFGRITSNAKRLEKLEIQRLEREKLAEEEEINRINRDNERKARKRMSEEEEEMKRFYNKEKENEKKACKFMARLEQETRDFMYTEKESERNARESMAKLDLEMKELMRVEKENERCARKAMEVIDSESRANEIEVRRLEEENAKLKQELKEEKRRQLKEKIEEPVDEEMDNIPDRFSELADQVENQKLEQKIKEKQNESREVIEDEVSLAKPEDTYREQRLEGIRNALLKAMDKESIEAIALIIPVEEGEDFKQLKMEAMEKIKDLNGDKTDENKVMATPDSHSPTEGEADEWQQNYNYSHRDESPSNGELDNFHNYSHRDESPRNGELDNFHNYSHRDESPSNGELDNFHNYSHRDESPSNGELDNFHNYSHRDETHEGSLDEWTTLYDENGNEYYYNNYTCESTWTKPKSVKRDNDWTVSYDEHGNEYYVNNTTGESSWTRPNIEKVTQKTKKSNIFQRIARKMDVDGF